MSRQWRCIHRHTKEEHPSCYARVHNIRFKNSQEKKGYQRKILYASEYLEKMTSEASK